ncbi:MAG: flagellar biosynthesis protein FlhG [bacterium]|jgi:flagellar biosynthesis protein FlhG
MAKKEIWAIGGGKGGVGKSLICSNIALDLAQKGYNVVVIDADLGGANLHTCLGIGAPKTSLSDFVTNRNFDFERVLVSTPYPNLRIASGAQDILDMANLKYHQQNKLKKAFSQINADYVLVDLGAGTASYVLDFFLLADKGILVSIPEPTAIENAYRFLKTAFYRKLKIVIHHPGVRALVEQLTTTKSADNPRTPVELMECIHQISSDAGDTLKSEMALFKPKLIINQIRSKNDIRVGHSMTNACLKYFGVDMKYTGYVKNDDEVLRAVRLRKPILSIEPNSIASRCIKQVTQNLLDDAKVLTNSP